jgi:two-component system nitrate/nitrite response regulator NarL
MMRAETITYHEFERRENRSVRTFLISDHRLLIDAFTDLMRDRKDFSIVGSITELELLQESFKKIQLLSVDVVLIDSAMKEADPIQITRKLKGSLPDSRIVILGLENDEKAILRFVEAGAVGYVLKPASLEDMSKTINAIHKGQSPCSSRVAALVFNKMAQLARVQRDNSSTHRVSLSVREKEILALMSVGLNNKDIASRLNIAFHTVKNHVHNILEKFQVHNRREAVELANQQGLIDKTLISTLGLLRTLIFLAGYCICID